MFRPRQSSIVLAWMVITVLAATLSGCGSDDTQAPWTPNPTDEAPPLAPTGLGARVAAADKFIVTWAPNAEPDLAGYRVYYFDPSPERADAFRCLTPGNLLRENALRFGGQSGTTYIFKITAVDASGNESATSSALEFTFSPSEEQTPGVRIDDPPTGGHLPHNGGHDQEPADIDPRRL